MNDLYDYTGVGATDDEEKQMRARRPLPMLAARFGPRPEPHELIHSFALAHGLPEVSGFYGYDFEERQFIKARKP